MHKFEISRADINLAIAVQGHEHYDQSFAGGYALIDELSGVEIWGYGGYKNTETFYIVGLAHALTERLPFVQKDNFSCHFWAETKGFIENLMRHYPAWRSRGGLTTKGTKPDAYSEAEYLYAILTRGRLRVDRLTPKHWPPTMKRCDEVAKTLTHLAFEKKAYKQIGIMQSGIDFDLIA